MVDIEDGYHYAGKPYQAQAETRFSLALGNQQSFNSLYQQAKEEGWSYRRQTMQDDWRRFQAIERSSTDEKREKAAWWYDSVFSEVQKRTGYNTQKTLDTIREAKKGNYGSFAGAMELVTGEDDIGAYFRNEAYAAVKR